MLERATVFRLLAAFVGVALPLCFSSAKADESPLLQQPSQAPPFHEQIDQLIETEAIGPLSSLTSDAEFLRRVHLDLHGMIPPTAEARDFLNDSSPDKRLAVIDQLLADPQFSRHMAGVFDVMLMERRGDKYVPAAKWRKYLEDSLARNKPFNQLAAELLGAEGVEGETQAAAKFYLDRDGETHLLTREVSRIFFGMDLQCAQCHDHPLVDDFKQADYYGIFAFLNRSYVFQPDKKKPAVFAEKGEGDVTFKSVFTGESGQTRPRLPGDAEIAEPSFQKGEEYSVKPDKNVRPVPKFSRRAQLAKLAVSGQNAAFNRNIANRLWAHLMGRGLVHPVDLHHSDNPPSNPELLDLLARELVAMKYDMRQFLRELARTRTYQRSVEAPKQLDQVVEDARSKLPETESRVAKLAEDLQQSAESSAQQQAQLELLKKQGEGISQGQTKVVEQLEQSRKQRQEAVAALSRVREELAARNVVFSSLSDAASQIAAAVQALPQDDELKQAAATFEQRAKQVADQVRQLGEAESQGASTLQAASEALKQKEGEAEAINQELQALQAKLSTADQAWNALHARRRSLQRELAKTKHAVQARQQLVGLGAILAEVAQAQDAGRRADERLQQVESDLQQAETEHASLVDKSRETEEARALASQNAERFRRELEQRQATAQLVDQALQKAKQAVQLLPEDGDLVQAAKIFEMRSQQFAKELTILGEKAAQQSELLTQAAAATRQSLEEIKSSAAQLEAHRQQFAACQAQCVEAAHKREELQAQRRAKIDELSDNWAARFNIASLKPKSPEQMAWSVMQATGLLQRQRTSALDELNKKSPLGPEAEKDPEKARARLREAERLAMEKLQANLPTFITVFGAGAGQPQQEFFATVDQALFFSNGDALRQWLAPGGGNLTERLLKLEDPRQIAEEAYLSVFTRRPSDQESAEIADYLAQRKDAKQQAVQEIVWALITSTEFRFNY